MVMLASGLFAMLENYSLGLEFYSLMPSPLRGEGWVRVFFSNLTHCDYETTDVVIRKSSPKIAKKIGRHNNHITGATAHVQPLFNIGHPVG
jgi:hypothetical protein